MTLKGLILTILTCLQLHLFGQLMLDDINLDRIDQRTVRKYIECQLDEGKHEFDDIKPSWNSGKDLSSFRKKEMTFFLEGNYTDIWKGYVSADPSLSWNGRNVAFGLLLLRFPCGIFYNHDPIKGVDSGQIYFLKLRLLFGLYGLPVAFEIIRVDEDERIIEFSYIEGNKSIGVQQIKFLDMGEDQTEIIHTSYYKSDSQFRDKWMYPHFHKIIITDFHRNMRKLLNQEKAGER